MQESKPNQNYGITLLNSYQYNNYDGSNKTVVYRNSIMVIHGLKNRNDAC